jgi:hypothetical protein
MRSPFLLVAVMGLIPSLLAAQQPPKPARLFLAVGPAWSSDLTGLQVRAEYSIMPVSLLGIRLDLGGRWTPTQTLSRPSALYGDGGRFDGIAQAADVNLSVTAVVRPWPRASISPYVVSGAAALQSWDSGRGDYRYADGSLAQAVPARSWTRGDLVLVTGFGLRLRLGEHPVQFELRRYGQTSAFTLGTALRF